MGKKKYITFHYKNELLSKYIIKDETKLLNKGNELLLHGLKKKHSLKEMIIIMKVYVDCFHHRRINKLKVSSEDHLDFVASLLGLMKLKQIHEDDETGYIITKFKSIPR
tara:strand:- start:7095 stop:7421 length:327 start_codon:yes stop_codon:yes gene_type:complete